MMRLVLPGPVKVLRKRALVSVLVKLTPRMTAATADSLPIGRRAIDAMMTVAGNRVLEAGGSESLCRNTAWHMFYESLRMKGGIFEDRRRDY